MLKITKILPLWAKLESNHQYNFKLLIDHKVASLTRGFRNPNLSPYDLLDRVLDFKVTIEATGFDTGSVKALIDAGVENIMSMNGLPYVIEDVNNDERKVQEEDATADVDADEVFFCS